MDWNKFQEEVVKVVETVPETEVLHKNQALVYARNILTNIDYGRQRAYSDEESTKIQILYVLNNLKGADSKSLKKINDLCKNAGINITNVIQTVVPPARRSDE